MTPQTPAKVSLRKVRAATKAALDNEQLTRQRVDQLESWAGAVVATVTPMSDLLDYLDTGIWARLRWLALGHNAMTPARVPLTADTTALVTKS